MAGDLQGLMQAAARADHAGRVPEAIAAYEAVLALRPDLPNCWFNLAMAQREARMYDRALGSYHHALRWRVACPEEVHLRRAVILSDHLGRPGEAMDELTTALKISPAYVPAWLNLGNLHEDFGRRGEAIEAYRQALRHDPGNALALARLAGVAELRGQADPLLQTIRLALEDRSRSLDDRADLGFALGRALDQVAAYDEAFAAYARANAATRAMAAARGIHYDRDRQVQLTDQLIDAFRHAIPARDDDPRVPLFICGMFRSGSTLVEQVLARHPAFTAGGELDILPALVDAALQPYPERVATIDPVILEGIGATYLSEVSKRTPLGTRLTDKRPDNFLHIGLIKRLFPSARIIRTKRATLDTILSVFFLHADPTLAYATDLDDIAHYLGEQERLMAHWCSLYPSHIHEVDYDRLVVQPREELASLLEFCGVSWRDDLLQPQNEGAVRTASAWQVRQPLYRGSSGRWRNYRSQLDGMSSGTSAGLNCIEAMRLS